MGTSPGYIPVTDEVNRIAGILKANQELARDHPQQMVQVRVDLAQYNSLQILVCNSGELSFQRASLLNRLGIVTIHDNNDVKTIMLEPGVIYGHKASGDHNSKFIVYKTHPDTPEKIGEYSKFFEAKPDLVLYDCKAALECHEKSL